MSPDEVLNKLKQLGVNITRKTLLNYESFGLVKPVRGGGGRGIGRFTDYQPNAAEHAFAIYHMLNSSNYSSGEVVRLAELIPSFMQNPFKAIERLRIGGFRNEYENSRDINMLIDNYLKDFFFVPMLRYLTYFFVAAFNVDNIEPINIVFSGSTASGRIIEINKKYILENDDVNGKFKCSEIVATKDNDALKYTDEKGMAKYFFCNNSTHGVFEIIIKTNLNKK